MRLSADEIDGILLLDGLHTSYPFDATLMGPFLAYARRAVAGEKVMVITHSEIFPGTFASTTETTDYLVRELDLKRRPVLKWGSMGTQQLSEVRRGKFLMMGFAGNSASRERQNSPCSASAGRSRQSAQCLRADSSSPPP